MDEDEIDLSSIELSHYRVSKIRQQHLIMQESTEYKLVPGDAVGTAKAKDKKVEFLSQIVHRLNELFVTDHLSEADMVNYANTISDKVRENELVMHQLFSNSPEQAMLGDFPKAVDDAVMDSGAAHQNQMMQLLSDPSKAKIFSKVIFDILTRPSEQ